MWNYSLFHNPLSTWTAHAYAIQIDDKNKRIICIGGIEWGFQVKLLSFISTDDKAYNIITGKLE